MLPTSQLLLQIRIGTRLGVRLEALTLAPEDAMAPALRLGSVVLQPDNGFAASGVRVRSWRAPRCFMQRVTAARFQAPLRGEPGYDASESESSEAENDDDDDGSGRLLAGLCARRRRTAAFSPGKRRRLMRDAGDTDDDEDANGDPTFFFEIELPDEEEVGYVWLLPLGPAVQHVHGHAQETLPHPECGFRIENTCGSCLLDAPMDMETVRPLVTTLPAASARRARRGVIGGELITTLSGTFAPCLNRQQVDFRGVRSAAAMMADWSAISGGVPAVVRLQLYMVVLKANLGQPVLLIDHGNVPDGLTGKGATIATEGRKACYLAMRMARWCVMLCTTTTTTTILLVVVVVVGCLVLDILDAIIYYSSHPHTLLLLLHREKDAEPRRLLLRG